MRILRGLFKNKELLFVMLAFLGGYLSGKSSYSRKEEITAKSNIVDKASTKNNVITYKYRENGTLLSRKVDKTTTKRDVITKKSSKSVIIQNSNNWMLGLSTNKDNNKFKLDVGRKVFKSLYINVSLDTDKNIYYGFSVSF